MHCVYESAGGGWGMHGGGEGVHSPGIQTPLHQPHHYQHHYRPWSSIQFHSIRAVSIARPVGLADGMKRGRAGVMGSNNHLRWVLPSPRHFLPAPTSPALHSNPCACTPTALCGGSGLPPSPSPYPIPLHTTHGDPAVGCAHSGGEGW